MSVTFSTVSPVVPCLPRSQSFWKVREDAVQVGVQSGRQVKCSFSSGQRLQIENHPRIVPRVMVVSSTSPSGGATDRKCLWRSFSDGLSPRVMTSRDRSQTLGWTSPTSCSVPHPTVDSFVWQTSGGSVSLGRPAECCATGSSSSRRSADVPEVPRSIRGKSVPADGRSQLRPVGPRIAVHIYDLFHSDGSRNLNQVFANKNVKMKFGGLFHVGVEVNGIEWNFGGSCTKGVSGVGWHKPRKHPDHHYRESVVLGRAKVSAQKVNEIIGQMYEDYPFESYDLLRRNCCHFAEDFVRRLGLRTFPQWVHRLANIGAGLDDVLHFARFLGA